MKDEDRIAPVNGPAPQPAPPPEGNEVSPRQVRLSREHGWKLRLTINGRGPYDHVRVVRAAPLSDPNHFVSFLDEQGNEICTIEEPAQLDEVTRRLLREELDLRYLVSTILRIHSARSEQGISYFNVETNRGQREFIVQNAAENARRLGEHRLLLVDVDGNRFEIPDCRRLDKISIKLLDIAL